MTITLGPYQVHPLADQFPMIAGDEFAELVDDVKSHGLRHKIIVTHDGRTLIDGRNRYRACDAAGLKAGENRLPADYTERQILDLIMSLNARRRDMSTGQKAMMALAYEQSCAELVKAEEASRKARDRTLSDVATVADPPQSSGRKSRELAGKAAGVSGRAVSTAKAVQRDAPDLADKVRNGALTLDAADRERKKRERDNPKPKPEPAPKPTSGAGPVMLSLRTHVGDLVDYPQPKSKSTFNQTSGPGISWAEWSWNPVTGCLHGCDYCYAREIATSDRYAGAYPVGFTPLFHEERLNAPADTTIPAAHRDDPAWRRVFVCSMADLYGRWVPDEWIERVHQSMLASPQWQYILLTKFPSRYPGLALPPGAWVGTSVDEQKRVRIAENAFRNIEGAAVKWLSLEPLRERLIFDDLSMFDWVVIGAQTSTRQPGGKVVPAVAPSAFWVARILSQIDEINEDRSEADRIRVHIKPNMQGNPGVRWPDEYPEIAMNLVDDGRLL